MFDMELCHINLERFVLGNEDFALRGIIGPTFDLLARPSGSWDGLRPFLPYGVRVFEEISQGLFYLHQSGLVHRDIKSQNSTHLIVLVNL